MKITAKTIEALKAELEKIEPSRQHGRKGKVLEDSEAEMKRLYNNLASRLCRAKKRLLEQQKQMNKLAQSFDSDLDQVDIRRYKNCFVYENIMPEKVYIKRMTGLTDTQIIKLERLTGLKAI